jgi:hypothetical protein
VSCSRSSSRRWLTVPANTQVPAGTAFPASHDGSYPGRSDAGRLLPIPSHERGKGFYHSCYVRQCVSDKEIFPWLAEIRTSAADSIVRCCRRWFARGYLDRRWTKIGIASSQRIGLIGVQHVSHRQPQRIQIILNAKKKQRVRAVPVNRLRLQSPQPAHLHDGIARVQGHRRESHGQPPPIVERSEIACSALSMFILLPFCSRNFEVLPLHCGLPGVANCLTVLFVPSSVPLASIEPTV